MCDLAVAEAREHKHVLARVLVAHKIAVVSVPKAKKQALGMLPRDVAMAPRLALRKSDSLANMNLFEGGDKRFMEKVRQG